MEAIADAHKRTCADEIGRGPMKALLSDTILRLPEVLEATRLSRSTIYDQVRKGLFPKPVRLGERAIGWRRSDIEQWLQARHT